MAAILSIQDQADKDYFSIHDEQRGVVLRYRPNGKGHISFIFSMYRPHTGRRR